MTPLLRQVTFFFLFAAISWGFGYATIVRYDPRTTGISDSAHYYNMVHFNYDEVPAPWRYRILTPTLAGLIYKILPASGLRNWDGTFLSLLIVNSTFMSLTAILLMRLVGRLLDDPVVELVTPFVYLASFTGVNAFAAGLVDAGEAFFLCAIMLTVVHERWLWLPVLLAVGVLAKQTVAPLGLSFAVVWCLLGWKQSDQRMRQVLALLVAGTAAAIVLVGIQALIGGEQYARWSLSREAWSGLVPALLRTLTARTLGYAFLYLGPLGLLRLRAIPARFRYASLAAALTVIALGTYARIGVNINRPLFIAIGPLLSMSCAVLLCELVVNRSKAR